MKRSSHKSKLKNKVSVLFALLMLVILTMLGIYFDTFLKSNFLFSSKKRIQHGFHRLIYNINHIETNLINSTRLIDNDESMLASIELINNYQDKSNYNTFLIDEEKKLLLKQLLSRVKLSLNDDIALYDINDELIAFITKQGQHYHLNYYSYQNGQKQLFGKNETAPDYRPEQPPEHHLIGYKHQALYSQNDIKQRTIITYHNFERLLVIKSHHSLFYSDKTASYAHIELSKYMGPEFFGNLSKDLGISFTLTDTLANNTESELLTLNNLEKLRINLEGKHFIGTMRLNTLSGTVYFVSALETTELIKILKANRQQLLIFFAFTALIILLLVRLWIDKDIARPLARLMKQIKKIEHLDYSPSKVIKTRDELEEISYNINQLANTVQERERSLKQSKQELEHLSNHDPLTGLPNRRFFNDRLEHALEKAKRDNTQLSIIFFDLDEFKQINDTLGHDIGDQLLIEVAKHIKNTIRRVDTFARISGDEFIILLEHINDVGEIEIVLKKIIAVFSNKFNCLKHRIRTTASIGISIYPQDGQDSVSLVKHADLAMYMAKDNGRNSYRYFTESLSDQIKQKTDKIQALSLALEQQTELQLFYQPTICAHSQKITGIEALIRWHSKELGIMLPDQFIPLAEETGLIIKLGEWVLHQACSDFQLLKQQNTQLNHIAINVSNVQFKRCDMVALLQKTIASTGISASEIELEITESYLISNETKALKILQKIRDMEIKLAINDFGTGYSSMSYLQKLPITRIKIDKVFVHELPENKGNMAISHAIIGLAKTFNLHLTAEGVETHGQYQCLKQAQCDEIQGFLFSKPLPLAELTSFINNWEQAKKSVTDFSATTHSITNRAV